MILKLDNVSKCIHGTTVIDSISVSMESGNVYGLQGYNGSGKTMLMRLIAGLIRPTQGRIYYDQKILGNDMDFPPSIGLLIENAVFLNPYTGFQNLKLLTDIRSNTNDEQIRNTLEYVGLQADDKRRYKKYSLGMKQRLGIASAVMERPEIIILDEPMNALDKAGVDMAKKLIMRERDRGALVIVSCHEEEILGEISDTVYTIEHGRIIKRDGDDYGET